MNSELLKQNYHTRMVIPEKRSMGINHHFFFCGSCFSENMGKRLQELQFNALINPFGILYDPLSIMRCIDRIHSGIPYSQNDLYFYADTFHALDHHGSFRSSTAHYVLSEINTKLEQAQQFIMNCQVAVITLGTSFVYYHEPSGKHVANCHKLPNASFKKELLTEKQILESIQLLSQKLLDLNPNIQLIFTVSPVKHLRDGVVENSLSKARLVSAINQFVSAQKNIVPDYFPAFEIMNEELRDHRYYESDLAHPTAWSINYIFQRFIETQFDDPSREFIEKYEKYLLMQQHRPLTSNNTELSLWADKKKQFLNKILLEFPDKIINSDQSPMPL